MSRNYGSLGRRSSSAAWQWVLIGAILGFACSAVLVLGGLAAGVLTVAGQSFAFGVTPTPVVMVITATPLPATPTLPPTEVIITPTTQPAAAAGEVLAPTATPTVNPALITPSPTAAPTLPLVTMTPLVPAGGTPGQQSLSAQQVSESGVPDILINIASELRPVSGGTFQMGTTPAEAAAAVRQCTEVDEGQCNPAYAEDSYPQHPATVSAFQIETTEVTYQQYLTFLNFLGPGTHANGCDGQPCLATRNESDTSNVTYDSANYDVPDVINNMPVVEVTWYGAKAYCETLGRRLPTEAEWERAARGDDGRVFPWGNEWNPDLAKTSRSTDTAIGSVPVDSYPTGGSPYAVLNMGGNVAEWVSDWYDARFYYSGESTKPDPAGPPLGDEKVVRGGSWDAVPFFSRTMHRQSRQPTQPAPWLGFRCAADAGTPANPNANQPSNTGAGGNVQLNPLIAGTPNPETLGVVNDNEGDVGNSQPTIPPAPQQPTIPPAAQPAVTATLDPGG